ncbi:MAG: hypothetical protein RTV31_04260 [Candidatus Thorarchaeota archaeon]
MTTVIKFDDLDNADLIVDAIYERGDTHEFQYEPLQKLLSVANQGGFRPSGKKGNYNFVILFSTLDNVDWPDRLDLTTGEFVYYGDNRKAGQDLSTTKGNQILEDCFSKKDSNKGRKSIPPFFVFTSSATHNGVVFKGIAAPGSLTTNSVDELISLWKISKGTRFQNYRAIFTILDEPVVSREFIQDLLEKKTTSENTPANWKK